MAEVGISELKAFIEVARHQSFRRAADVQGVSRSSLSHAIRLLEQRMTADATTDPPKQHLRAKDFRAMLPVSERTFWRMLKAGQLPPHKKLGKVRRVAEELEQMDSELGHLIRTGEQLQDALNANRKRKPEELTDEIELDELCHTSAARYRGMAGQRTISVKLQTEPALVLSSASSVEGMLTNLLENAIIYGPASASILLACGQNDNTAWLSVADEGAGPPDHVIEDVFGEHVFAETTRSARANAGGHGIGLLTVRQLAENCGITITNEPLSPTGWRVTLSWPK